ncbi:MAG: rhomboid family intramembrane serine protease [Chthoniobacter sp.]|nr:rhomboid family intramembrane serine protease [Chthoniobacter sp.]
MIPLSDNQPTSRFPFVTAVLILANALVFVGWELRVGLADAVQTGGFIPALLTQHEPGATTRLLTSLFMHGGWMHLIGNMWFLWIFGDNVEDACGPLRFLAFYLLCGVAATLAHTWPEPDSLTPLVGASGAISGVLGAYLLKHPRAAVRTLIPLGFFTRIMDVPAWFFLLIWMGMQVLLQAGSRGGHGGGVAYLAHIGGFVAGMGLIVFFEKGKPRANTK